jgi:hypothetical protein
VKPLALLLGLALIVSVAPGARAQDETSPTAELFVPQTGAGVPRDPLVSVFFSEQVTGVTPSSVRLRDATTGTWVSIGRFWYESAGLMARLRPEALLAPGHRYEVVLRPWIRDVAGNSLVATTLAFRVDPDGRPPRILVASPPAGATGVSCRRWITIRFDEPVRLSNGASLWDVETGALVRRSSSLWYGGTVLAVDARDLRAHHRYRVVVSSVVRDLAGNPFAGASWRFSTGC